MTKVKQEKISQSNGLHPTVEKTCCIFASLALGELKITKTLTIHIKSVKTVKIALM